MVLHLRPGPDDQAALLLKVDNAGARLTGLLGRIAQDRPGVDELGIDPRPHERLQGRQLAGRRAGLDRRRRRGDRARRPG
jgi:hypothetical protein